MKVFISWAGSPSREYAEVLHGWLPRVLQIVDPFFTPDEIEKGARWNSVISGVLEEAEVGILCLTRENLGRPWLLFEAGALSKRLRQSRVCPLLFGVKSTDLEGPLAQFQSTAFEKKEVERLLQTINEAAGERGVPGRILESTFRAFWPELEDSIREVAKSHTETPLSAAIRSERELLEELLALQRIATLKQSDEKDTVGLSSALGFLQAYIAVHDRLISGESRQAILESLREIRQPLVLFVKLCFGEGKETKDLLKRIDALSFLVRGHDDVGTRAPF